MASFLSQKFNPSSLAARGELLARQHYQRRGWRILGSNLFNGRGKRIGEIDFVALQPGIICFVEVKTRSHASDRDRFGGARYAVGRSKQRKLRKLAQLFLLRYPQYRSLRPQIDVCLVEACGLDKKHFSVTIIPHAVNDGPV